ncbi:twin-arginine translocase subunit TatC [Kiritimatiella glycovorans]|uniref:Sec-independent protein translocase protein TatC n=1 Tax=Kiritimatiella glycovorans TaxID=1307763 RepID=A0A0G3EF76_9BACT|nr:twin-arginine translocase subunit TatC [Kiritimatiella glycovorans]AKJ64988.1 Sec-independent protein translocase protein TatC [Kiritimatiella glycovorans]
MRKIKQKWTERFAYDEEDRPFLDHLEAFRVTLIRCVITVVVTMLICIPLAPFIIRTLQRPLKRSIEDPSSLLISMQVAGAFTLTMKVVFASGIILGAPVLLFYIGEFVLPGIKETERKWVLRFIAASGVLFAVGVAMGYLVTLPLALRVMLKIHEWIHVGPMWTINSYIGFALQLLLGFGLAFELPVILFILGKMGIVDSRQLRRYRRHVIIGLLVMAMILTPPDITTQVLMALPLIVLYECCIWLLWFTGEKQETEDAEPETAPDTTGTDEGASPPEDSGEDI